MAHHEPSNGKIVILHQRLKPFAPILAKPTFEWLKGFGDVAIVIIDESVWLLV